MALTLPEDVIAALHRLDDDLARAVVRLSQPLIDGRERPETVELSQHHDDAVIVVPPAKGLERIDGVSLVPLPDGRALISLDEAMTTADFELSLRYALDAEQELTRPDRAVMASIAEILRHARHTKGISLHERSIIVLKVNGRQTAPRKLPVAAGRKPRARRAK